MPCVDGSPSGGTSGRVSGQPKCGNVPNAEGRKGVPFLEGARQSHRLCREQAVVQGGKVECI